MTWENEVEVGFPVPEWKDDDVDAAQPEQIVQWQQPPDDDLSRERSSEFWNQFSAKQLRKATKFVSNVTTSVSIAITCVVLDLSCILLRKVKTLLDSPLDCYDNLSTSGAKKSSRLISQLSSNNS